MDTTPSLTLVPAHVADPTSEIERRWTPVDPATRTGCVWYVVPSSSAGSSAPHAA